MQITLVSSARKLILLSSAILVTGLYLTVATRQFLGASFSVKADLQHLQRAVRMAPGSAEFHQILGRYYFASHKLQAAAEQYRIATRLNPYNAHYWFELAGTSQILGDTDGQRNALQHAIQAEPTTPDVAWEAANFFLIQGDTANALHEFRVAMDNDPAMINPALEAASHIADVDTMIREELPPKPESYLALIDSLLARKDSAGAAKVWDRLVKLGKPFPAGQALSYVNYLIVEHAISQARIVWRQTAQLCGFSAYLTSHDNLIVNGSFNSDILNGGFDWRYLREPSVELALDPTDFHGGRRSLSIAFEGPGVNDAGIFQFIPVEPETTYEFSAYFKSDHMDGAGGPRFSIQDAYSGATYLLSNDLKDADIWREATGKFTTSPETQLVVLRLLRVPAGSAIRGKLWVDDFRLTEKQR